MQLVDNQRLTKTRPAGLEPATYGLEIRCSIQSELRAQLF